MARKTGSKNTATIERKKCSACQKDLTLREFYISYNPLHSDGRTPMCKECITNACYDAEHDEVDLDKLQSVLRQLDKPFISEHWKAALSQCKKSGSNCSNKTALGYYFKNINSLPQVKTWSYEQGLEYEQKQSKVKIGGTRRKNNSYNDQVFYLQEEEFEVTKDIIRLFGEGYTAKEYETMNRIYDDMKQEYPNISNNQKNQLLRYVRFAAKEEIATSNGLIADAEKWSKMATEALKQLNSIDTQGGISCFSEFFRDFERVQDVSRILPKFKYRPNDAPDFIIWCYINYCRRLEGKPEVEYADVYKFYDEKINEYLKQYGDPYGIFADDPTLSNREKIKEFIELPPDYYGDGD